MAITYKYAKGMFNWKNYLKVDPFTKEGTRVTKVVPKKYGYLIHMFNNYITLYYLKVVVNNNGTAKISWKIDKNYHTLERFTTYHNSEGNEISKNEFKQLN